MDESDFASQGPRHRKPHSLNAASAGGIAGRVLSPQMRLCLELLHASPFNRELFQETLENSRHISLRLLALVNHLGHSRRACKSASQLLQHVAIEGLLESLWLIAASDLLQGGLHPQAQVSQDRSRDQLWRHGLVTGIVARDVCRQLLVPVRLPLAAGVAHDLGHLLLPAPDGEQDLAWHTDHDVGSHAGDGLPLEFDHSELGARLLAACAAPRELQETARFHHCPQAAPADCRLLVLAVRVADLGAEFLEAPEPPPQFDIEHHPVWGELCFLCPAAADLDINHLVTELLMGALQESDRLVSILGH